MGVLFVCCTEQDAGFGHDEVWTTWKARKKRDRESIARHCIDYIMYSQSLSSHNADSSWTMRATRVLDGFPDKQVSNSLLPSRCYPSDHIAIAADLEIFKREGTSSPTPVHNPLK
jgi:exonuclease III